MPAPDCEATVINGKTGYVRRNTSWIIGRIVRDFEHWSRAKSGLIADELDAIIEAKLTDDKHKYEEREAHGDMSMSPPSRRTRAGLCVSIFKAGARENTGHRATKDPLYYSGIAIAIFQIVIAAIPLGVFGDWSVLLITIAGTALSLITGYLPQWRREKWAGRNDSDKTIIISRGNGAQHAIVINGEGRGLDLEDLAAVANGIEVLASRSTSIALVCLAVAWVFLLITAASAPQNSWFLLAIGGLGVLHNAFVAGWRRDPEAFGIPLEFDDVIGHQDVMIALMLTEQELPHVGYSLLSTFFPGELRPAETQEWNVLRLESAAKDAHRKFLSANKTAQHPAATNGDHIKATKCEREADEGQTKAKRAREAFGQPLRTRARSKPLPTKSC